MTGLAKLRRLLIVTAAVTVVAGGGCQAVVDLDGLENRHCGPDEKACPDQCVPKNNPATGCALLQCAPCAPPHAKAKCGLNGECAPDGCLGTWRDCNQDPRDGCETDVAHDPKHCGDCNAEPCARPMNGIAGCTNKQCVIGGCNPGWENCDGDLTNGCERAIWTDQECMTCDLPCPTGTSCAQGVCI
jgi:hypothetical protein